MMVKRRTLFLIRMFILVAFLAILIYAFIINALADIKLVSSNTKTTEAVHLTIDKLEKVKGKHNLTYSIVNNSNESIVTGEGYKLFLKEKSGWVEKNDQNPIFISIAYIVEKGSKKEFTGVLELSTKKIGVGEYKLSKQYTIEKTDGTPGENKEIEIEFVLNK